MAKKMKRLLEMNIDEFEALLKPAEKNEHRKLFGARARLIPGYKKLDEMSLASIFLASLPMVKEFRELISKEIGMNRSGYLKAYTEVSFPEVKIYNENSPKKGPLRVDGLLLQVIGKQIRDATFFEMKMGSQEIYSEQIESYVELAKIVGVSRLVTISNQFVPSTSDFPIEVQNCKGVSLFHFSWRYIIALGSVLLTDNELNIEDPDQVLIMNEVMDFLRDPVAEAKTFDSMSKEWVEVTEGILADDNFGKRNISAITLAVQDWIQEEQDLALKMSDELGAMVDCNIRRYKTMSERIERETKEIIENYRLLSEFKFPNTISPLNVTLNLKSRRLFCDVEIKVPHIAKTEINKRSQIGKQLNFVKRQLDACRQKNESAFEKIEPNLYIIVKTKGRNVNPMGRFSDFDELIEESIGTEIISVQLSYQIQLGSIISKRKIFISEYEAHIRNFYGVVLQYLKNHQESPPKLVIKETGQIEEDNATAE
ncbi:MAG: hypothetical protein WDA17_04890 [Sphaerochaetaceae bacterium]